MYLISNLNLNLNGQIVMWGKSSDTIWKAKGTCGSDIVGSHVFWMSKSWLVMWHAYLDSTDGVRCSY